MAFGRIIHLYVGKFAVGNLTSQNSKDFSQFDIEFEVTRSIEWYDNEATITIYNPSPEAINFIMSEGNSVLLQAGYEDETVGNIFVGQIGMAVPRRVGSDVELVITCVSARGTFYQLARLNCAIQFDSSATVKKCLQELCDYAGTALRAGNQKELSQPIGTEFCISGTFKQAVCSFRDNILIPKFGLHLYFDNNEMIVVNSDEKSIEVEEITLDFKSGLLQARGRPVLLSFLAERSGRTQPTEEAQQGNRQNAQNPLYRAYLAQVRAERIRSHGLKQGRLLRQRRFHGDKGRFHHHGMYFQRLQHGQRLHRRM